MVPRLLLPWTKLLFLKYGTVKFTSASSHFHSIFIPVRIHTLFYDLPSNSYLLVNKVAKGIINKIFFNFHNKFMMYCYCCILEVYNFEVKWNLYSYYNDFPLNYKKKCLEMFIIANTFQWHIALQTLLRLDWSLIDKISIMFLWYRYKV